MKNLFDREKIDIHNLNDVIKSASNILKVAFVLLVIIGVYAITLIFKEWKILNFILLLLKILSPFFIGLVIAWLLDPCVKFLYNKGINRIVGTVIVYLVMLAILYLFITGIFPLLLSQINDFVETLPTTFEDITSWLNNFIDRFRDIGFIDVDSVKDDLVNSVNSIVLSLTMDTPTNVVTFIKGLFSTVGIFALGLMIGFYLLFDFDNVGKVLLSILPKNARRDALNLFSEANDSLFGYVKGTLFVSLLIFALSSIVFTFVGLRAPLLFGLICGVTNIIPYIGPYLGAIPAAIVAFTQGVPIGIITVACLTIIQFIEGNFIQPLVMSKTMKLHPVTILLGLLIFGYFFGVLGMIIATPLVAVLKSILIFVENKYNILKFNKEK